MRYQSLCYNHVRTIVRLVFGKEADEWRHAVNISLNVLLIKWPFKTP